MLVGGALVGALDAGKAAVHITGGSLEDARRLGNDAGAGVSGAVSIGLTWGHADLQVGGLGGDGAVDFISLALLLEGVSVVAVLGSRNIVVVGREAVFSDNGHFDHGGSGDEEACELEHVP